MASPDQVGRFEIVSPLRSGGMARIDLARLRGPYELCRHAVIKRPLVTTPSATAAELEQFRVEARLLGSLHHPNIIGFLEAGIDDRGVDYLALEYVHGASLRELAPPRGPTIARELSLAATLSIITEVAAGLHHVHEQTDAIGTPLGIVHRDVSPSNILLGYDGSVRLIDFGVAKLTEGATASNSLRGKITYMAPEQCKGERIDRRADLYAVGVMLYELVTRRRPFHADDDVAALHKVIEGRVVPPRELVPELDPQLDAIILRAIAYRPEDRYATAAELLAALDQFAARAQLALDGSAIVEALVELGVTPEPWRGTALAEVAGTTPSEAEPVGPRPAAPATRPAAAADALDPPRSRARLAIAGTLVGVILVAGIGFAVSRVGSTPVTDPPTTVPPSPTADHAVRPPLDEATSTGEPASTGGTPTVTDPTTTSGVANAPANAPVIAPAAAPRPHRPTARKPSTERRPPDPPRAIVEAAAPADARMPDPREPRQWKPDMFLPGEGSGARR